MIEKKKLENEWMLQNTLTKLQVKELILKKVQRAAIKSRLIKQREIA